MSSADSFSVTYLGGAGEIGKNCAVIEVDDDFYVIDCGISFPDATTFGVDIIIPDFTYIYRNQHRIKGLFLTHGHEDHIGSIPYLIEGFDDEFWQSKALKIYGTKLTLGLLRNKIVERGQIDKVELIELIPGESIHLNGTTVTGYRVTHSIPDAVSLVFRTPYGNIVHSGDYKLDPAPVDGRLTDVEGLKAVGDEGVRLLMCDITNVEKPGRTRSESSVGPVLFEIYKNATGRVFTTTFASNIHRIQQIVNACKDCGRKVVFAGRSMVKNTIMAQEIGYLSVPTGMTVDIDDISRYAPSELCIVITGSQGEPMAALTQIAQDRHARLTIVEGDTVVFSASPIPGNETAIESVINDLFRLGAKVIWDGEWGVHASGHGSREDIEEYIGFIRADNIMPHHGQPRHVHRFKRVLDEMNVGSDRVLAASIGEKWTFYGHGYELTESVRAGVVFISGDTYGEIGRRTIKERQELAREGAVSIAIALSHDGRQILSDVVIDHKGFIPEHRDPDLYSKIREAVVSGVSGNRLRSREYRLQLQNNIGQLVATTINAQIGMRPNIHVLINYIDRDKPILEKESSIGFYDSGDE